jgi:sorbitol-6-phosphate 2-dehydrogenase
MEIAGMDLQYGLGTNYDEAFRAEGVSLLPTLPPSISRADVVRDKIALVTGGAQGFGEGMVRSLVEHGAFVYIADMNADGARKLSDELNWEACITVSKPITVNVTDETSVEAMMNQVAEETGGLDLFVSNAGVLRAGSVKVMDLKDFQFVTNVDYTGFFICTKFASRLMALQNIPSASYFTDIIAISSKSGLEGSNKNGAYAGAKFGTIGLTQSFALELVEDNIKVNAICPGNFLDGPLWSDPKRGLFVQYLEAGKVPGAKSVADVRRFYESKVPMNRGCRTEDVMKALLYIVEQTYETGQAVPVTGGQVMLN